MHIFSELQSILSGALYFLIAKYAKCQNSSSSQFPANIGCWDCNICAERLFYEQRNNSLIPKYAKCFVKHENLSNSRFPPHLGCWDCNICAERLFFEQRNHFLIAKNAKSFGKHENLSNSRFPAYSGC